MNRRHFLRTLGLTTARVDARPGAAVVGARVANLQGLTLGDWVWLPAGSLRPAIERHANGSAFARGGDWRRLNGPADGIPYDAFGIVAAVKPFLRVQTAGHATTVMQVNRRS